MRAAIVLYMSMYLCALLPSSAVAAEPCHHGVVCVKRPGPDLLIEARAGYAFYGSADGLTTEAMLGFGNLGLGLPPNIFFIGELGFTRGTKDADSGAMVQAFDASVGARAYWPTRHRLAAFVDVLFGAANHRVDADEPLEERDNPWTVMGQLALGMELHLFHRLFLVGRAKASFFGPGGALFVADVADGASHRRRHDVEAVRLAGTVGLNWCF